MAVIQKDFNVMGLPMAISRNNPIPLDKTAVWYDMGAMLDYVSNDPTAYVGQILGLVNEDAKTATAYIITSDRGAIKEVGAATVVDNHTIVLNDNGALSLNDFGKAFYKYVPATETEEAKYVKVNVGDLDSEGNAYAWSSGLEPKAVLENGNYVLGWYEPNPTTMEGVSASIAALQNSVAGLTQKDKEIQAELGVLSNNVNNRYTNAQIDSAIADAVADSAHLKREIVTELPDAADADPTIIYMVPSGLQDDDNKYYEWMLINGVMERVGSWEVDLSAYAKASDLENKVDKKTGYGLVANEEIAKLGTVAANAERNYVRDVSENFNVDANGKLTLTSIPTDLDLSQNTTIAGMNEAIDNKVEKVEGSSLVSNTLIDKLENIAPNVERNYINGVSTEFAVDNDRVLSIVSVPATKIADLKDNVEFKEVLSDIISLETNVGDLLGDLTELSRTVTANGTAITTLSTNFNALSETVSGHTDQITEIMKMLTWQELSE